MHWLRFTLCNLLSLISFGWSEVSLVLKPDDPFVFLGECLTFKCILSSIQNGNSSTLYIRSKGKNFPKEHYEIVDEKMIKFKLCVRNPSDAGFYICKQNITEDRTKQPVMQGQILKVEKPLIAIVNDSIKCLVLNWDQMNCTWSLGEEYLQPQDIMVNLIYKVVRYFAKCPKLLKTSCYWTRFHADLSMPFQLNLTVFHRKRPEKKLVTIFELDREKPVKPGKIYMRENSVFTNSSCINMTWGHSRYRKVFYEVTISSKHDEQQTIVSHISNILICGLLPDEKYKVNIYAFPKRNEKILSDPFSLDIKTNGSYPSQPPLMSNNSFKWDANHSSVVLYWNNLKREQSGAENIWYFVEIQNKTTRQISGKNNINLPLLKRNENCWFIQVWAENLFGRSKTSSQLKICKSANTPPRNVEMLIVNDSHVNIMWSKNSLEEKSVAGFKVFLCKNHFDDFQWWDVEANNSFIILPLENPNSFDFGVTTEHSLYGSSGLAWGSCYYEKKKPLKPVEFTVEAVNDKLKIKWKTYNCSNEKAFIIEYQVKYCRAINKTKCKEREKVKKISRLKNEFETSQLSPDSYLIWVEPLSFGGLGPSNLRRMIKLRDNSWSVGILIGLSSLGLVACIFFFPGCKFTYNECLSKVKKCNVEVKFPEINSDSYDDLKKEKMNNDPQKFYLSDENDSLTSSLQTETTQLSNIYVKIDNDSSDSTESIDNIKNGNASSIVISQRQVLCSPQDPLVEYLSHKESICISDQIPSVINSCDEFLDNNYIGSVNKNNKNDLVGHPLTEEDHQFPDYVQNTFEEFNKKDLQKVSEILAQSLTEEDHQFPDYVQNTFEEFNKKDFQKVSEILAQSLTEEDHQFPDYVQNTFEEFNKKDFQKVSEILAQSLTEEDHQFPDYVQNTFEEFNKKDFQKVSEILAQSLTEEDHQFPDYVQNTFEEFNDKDLQKESKIFDGLSITKDYIETEEEKELTKIENLLPTIAFALDYDLQYVVNDLENEPQPASLYSKQRDSPNVLYNTPVSGGKLITSDSNNYNQKDSFTTQAICEPLNVLKNSLEENFQKYKCDKTSPKNQITENSYLCNCDILENKETLCEFSAVKFENNLTLNEVNDSSYISIDSFQRDCEMILKLSQAKETTINNSSKDTNCDSHELNNTLKFQV